MAHRVLFIRADSHTGGQLASAFAEAGFLIAGAPGFPEVLAVLGRFKSDVVIIDEVCCQAQL